MIVLRQGNILKADAEAIVNTVNCVGVMGRGLALQYRKAFPENYEEYRKSCDRGDLKPGVMLIHELHQLMNPRYIVNFPTKRHWKEQSRIEDIESGLHALVDEIRKLGIRSIAIPPLGCGLGVLDWKIVRPMIEKAFLELSDVKVYLFEPTGISPCQGEAAIQ
jgi:O-acetyl-ADP-ribose deacetylase (regulator of RNase III)